MSHKSSVVMVAVSCVLSLGAGCSDDDGGSNNATNNIQQAASGRIVVEPVNVTFAQLAIGEVATEDVTITNSHDTDQLTLFELSLQPRDDGTAQDLELSGAPDGDLTLGPGEHTTVQIKFRAQGRANSATLDIISSDPTYSRQDPYSVDIDTLANRPQISVDPQVVRFPTLLSGQAQQPLVVRNFGTAPLVIYNAAYSGDQDFSLADPVDEQIVLDPYRAADAEQSPERYELGLSVNYQPRGDSTTSGQIVIESNDTRGQSNESGHGLTIVDVQANAQAPCILVDRTTRQFGQVPIGAESTDVVTVTNCGAEALKLSAIDITDNTADDEFSLDLGGNDQNGDDQLDAEVAISPGEDETFLVNYSPRQVGSDAATLVISSNDPAQPELELDLRGRGSDGACPEANVSAQIRGQSPSQRPTLSAAPLDYIVLDGSASTDPDGSIEAYEWTAIEQPDGVQIELGPTDSDSANSDPSRRQFRALVAGTYKFGLDVIDNEGFRACEPVVATIVATPDETIHIELTWSNPEDADQSDDSGSDVDLHLVKMGPGSWYEPPYDIFFDNPNSAGGGIWNPESPSLDIDDTDGAGPENIQMDDPVNCGWYAVGVDYYRQLYGTAYATVRIYVNQDLRYEQLNVPLQTQGQFLDVARIHWNQGGAGATIQDVNQLMPAKPFEEQPTVTDAMASSGLCTAAPLY